LFKNDSDIELWLYLDQILLDQATKEFTWNELLAYYQTNYPYVIAHVLP